MCLCFQSFFVFVLHVHDLANFLLLTKTELAFFLLCVRDSNLHDEGDSIIDYAVNNEKNDTQIKAVVFPDLPSSPPIYINRRIVEGNQISECLFSCKHWVQK